ncbi:SulP family inorganic anion transporter [Polyangium aurulentum]|uniref:SulP family inorganic anion transporter n=1 Tax=Polyangium aurulentum TaxID=2567896 RepID=UPI0010AE6292|nr:SulP family inorganic anion transporter [Polyangium aurulentum]UQA61309.1 SulP family inorganic anion transporter [Polyangium aurulentum]
MTLEDDVGKDHLRFDAAAGLVVFLVAVPLCLGIALASGAPLLSGLISGIVGGVLVGLLSGSEVSVSGPAVGLTVIVAGAIQNLGSYGAFLAAVVVAGCLQVTFGFLRLGVLADYVPTSVIKGMLAAIGIVLVLKQIPHALGRDLDFEADMSFIEIGGRENSLTAIIKALLSASFPAILVSGASLAALLGWERIVAARVTALRLVPAPLVGIVVGTLLNELLRIVANGFHLQGDQGHLVSLPHFGSPVALFNELHRPDWAMLKNERVYSTGLTLAAVASIETLLALEAAQKLDRYKRIVSPQRELMAQGVGNVVAGLLGGLPIASVVVRTSTNVYAGSRTRWSNVFHGILLLVAVLFLGRVLSRVPLAAVAAILIVIGLKLAPGEHFKEMWRQGWESFLPFAVTIVAIVFTDLLTGTIIGLCLGVFYLMRANSRSAMTLVSQDDYYMLRFNKDISFVHKAELREKLARIPEGATLIVDGTRALYLDRDAFDVLDDFQETAKFKDIKVEFKNLSGKRPMKLARSASHG